MAMRGLAGDTTTEVRVFATTGAGTVMVALPVTPLRVAVMAAEPAVSAEARPVEVTFAMAGLEDVQVADVVTFAVEPSPYLAVAVNCWMAPMAMVSIAGVTAMEVRVFGAAETVRSALPLTPSRVAVTVVEPAASAVTMPEAVIFAIAGLVSVQVADAVTSWLEPSL